MPGGQIHPHQSQAPQQQSRAEDHADRGNDGVSSHDEENDASGQHRSAVDDRQRKIRIPLHAVTPTRTVVRAIMFAIVAPSVPHPYRQRAPGEVPRQHRSRWEGRRLLGTLDDDNPQ